MWNTIEAVPRKREDLRTSTALLAQAVQVYPPAEKGWSHCPCHSKRDRRVGAGVGGTAIRVDDLRQSFGVTRPMLDSARPAGQGRSHTRASGLPVPSGTGAAIPRRLLRLGEG